MNFESIRNIDYILAGRRDWAGIVQRWTDYLAGKPDDGRALFERAGAHHHAGNEALSREDAKRACQLGVEPACARIGRQ